MKISKQNAEHFHPYGHERLECIVSLVLGIDMLHTRMFGNKVYIDLKISVDGDKSLWEAHDTIE